MAMNPDKELFLELIFSHFFMSILCHPSDVDNIDRKGSSSPLKDGYELGQGIVVGMDFPLICSMQSIAIRLRLII